MILVLPIYMGKRKTLWCSDSGRTILADRVHAALQAAGVEQVVVVTDEPDALHDVWPRDAAGVRCIVREANREREVSRFLPYGTRAALEAVQELTGGQGAPVMVADFRCPFVSSEDISSALSEFAASDRSSMVTVTAPRDNPCQLEGYYTISDVGLVHLFEAEDVAERALHSIDVLRYLPPSRNGWRVTRPFPFDWAAKGVVSGGNGSGRMRLFRRSRGTDRTVEYLPCKEEGIGISADTPACLWLYESEQAARLVVAAGGVEGAVPLPLLSEGAELAGACIRKEGTSVPLRLFRLADGRWCLHASGDMGSVRLHLLPVGGAGGHEAGHGVAIDAVEGFMEGGCTFLFDCSAENMGALAFWFLRDAGDQGGYDLRLDYPGEGKLWHTEKGTGRKLSMATGEHISGRQLFPEVYAPLRCLGILSACSYATYDSELAQGTCMGWVLPAERALRIGSDFDMLVYSSMTDADESA
ncbi:MAG: hypothetical protein ACK5JO_13645 [Halodesulfovibrio sp.]